MSKTLLLEVGCEELPPRMLQRLANTFASMLYESLTDQGIKIGEHQVYATPRRLAVMIHDVAEQQLGKDVERIGPSVKSAYDKNGMPTIACIGFAKSCGIATDQLKTKKMPKGDDRVYYHSKNNGVATTDVLPSIINDTLTRLPIAKPMRWGSHKTQFIRPVHWVMLMFGDKHVPGKILGLETINHSFGHRFHHPQAIKFSNAETYADTLKKQGFVIADYETRKKLIKEQIQERAKQNGRAVISNSLLTEVTALVEWPVVLRGQFDSKFLEVPREVLITSMQSHQKYFPVIDEQGHLKPYFILVSNIESKNPETVIQGNERVLNARLSDAAFFYEKDQKHTLSSHYSKLGSVVFQHHLGSIADKCERISKLAGHIAKTTAADTNTVEHAAKLCKCDLLTEMVKEFPSLQGIMGYYYALHDKETKDCAIAIREHYLPRFANDVLPETKTGISLALADKIDSLVGIIGINQLPTGDKDPFALRRAAIGVIRILIQHNVALDIKALIKQASELYNNLSNANVVEDVNEFILTRLRSWYLEQGIHPEVFSAVASRSPNNLVDFHQRILAVVKFLELPEAGALSAANKRVSNILKKQSLDDIPQAANDKLFEHDAERTLLDSLLKQQQTIDGLYQKANYTEILNQLAHLKQPIDDFFDNVMVMVDDKNVRLNRLALLLTLQQLFVRVADISLLPS